MEDKSHNPYCLPCIYYGKNSRSCDFIFLEDRRRPCPGGEGCTERRTKKDVKRRMGKPTWDTKLGQQMWLEGKKDREIAEHFGIAANTVTTCRRKYWEKHVDPSEKKIGTAPGNSRAACCSTCSAAPESQHVNAGRRLLHSGGGHQKQERHRSHLHSGCDPLPLELGQRRRSAPGKGSHQPSAQAVGGLTA